MPRTAIGLLLTAMQFVAALAPVAVCDRCREFGEMQIGFGAETCQHCEHASAAGSPVRLDAATGDAEDSTSEPGSTTITFGHPAPATEPAVAATALPDSLLTLESSGATVASALAPAFEPRTSPATQPGTHPGVGTYAPRC